MFNGQLRTHVAIGIRRATHYTPHMIQLSYVSSADTEMSSSDLLELLQQCLKNNPPLGVTGMLLYGNGTFLQTIEGDDAVVERLVEKIAKDPRHKKLQFFSRKQIEQRQYSGWSMGFHRMSDQELGEIEGLKSFGMQDFNSENLIRNDAVVGTLMDHYRAPHWDPLVRELEAQEKVIEHLKRSLARMRGAMEISGLVLESVAAAGVHGTLSEEHLRLCDTALQALKQS
jgi:hypothetical protein